MTTLQIEKRDKKESLEKIRGNGMIPAVFYGPKQESTSIKLKTTDFIKAYREAGESTIITLKDTSSKSDSDIDVLIQDISVDPVKGFVKHVDFYAVEKGKKVEVAVPLEFTGESQAEKSKGGIVVRVMHEVDVEAMPKDLPHAIEVSIDPLVDLDSQIHAKDLILPNGVTLLTDPEEVIAVVQEQKTESEDEPTEDPDLDSIEVEGEKKEDSPDAEKEEEK